MTMKPTRALKIFYCYAHKDKSLIDKLDDHLSGLKHQGYITSWHDHEISPGKEWEREIINQLKLAHIILLLVSPDFMASKYCYSIEMKKALAKHTVEDTHVVPILLRPVHWQKTPLGELQILPTQGKPITKWRNRDKAFLEVAQGIRKIIEAVS